MEMAIFSIAFKTKIAPKKCSADEMLYSLLKNVLFIVTYY